MNAFDNTNWTTLISTSGSPINVFSVEKVLSISKVWPKM